MNTKKFPERSSMDIKLTTKRKSMKSTKFCRELGERICEARKTLGLKRQDVAFSLGIALNTLGQYERGERELSPCTLARLSKILGRTPNWLLGFNGDDINEF